MTRLTYNDGLLAKHISEVERSSYEEAQGYIKINCYHLETRA